RNLRARSARTRTPAKRATARTAAIARIAAITRTVETARIAVITRIAETARTGAITRTAETARIAATTRIAATADSISAGTRIIRAADRDRADPVREHLNKGAKI
ncbi:MAG: hypothetical protein IKG66_09860, partial [Lachnospiraceae bacterium]|nr:hypothetical protein [Lachnospiraceae bacterium]